jgi:hypothetical protein
MKSGLTNKQVLTVFLMVPLAIIAMALFVIIAALITGQEGFASLLFLFAGIFLFIYFPFRYKSRIQWTSVPTVLFPFFVLLGATLDQTGNTLYNYPIEWKECASDEQLVRKIAHYSRGGKSSNSIEFFVKNTQSGKERLVHWWTIIWIRAVEYVFIGLILIIIQRIWWNLKYKGIRNLDGELLDANQQDHFPNTETSEGDEQEIQVGNIRIKIKKR